MRVIFTYARMNPPTAGHRKLANQIAQIAREEGGVGRLYVSLTHDSDRNPLTADQKLDFIQRSFPEIEVRLAKNLVEAGKDIAASGGTSAVMVVGEDRLADFTKFIAAYAGGEHFPVECSIRQIGREDDDASATKARFAAASGDMEEFVLLSPSSDPILTEQLFYAVRNGMGVKDVTI